MDVLVYFFRNHRDGYLLADQLHRRSATPQQLEQRVIIFEQNALAIYGTENIRRDVPPRSPGRQCQILTDEEIVDRASMCGTNSSPGLNCSAARFQASGTSR